MKKKLALILAMCLSLSTLFTGCSAPKPEKEAGNSPAKETGDTFDGTSTDYKVALMIPGNLGDKSFFDASFEAIGLIEKEFGMKVDYVEAGRDASKYYSAYVDLCEKGYDLILTVSSNGDDALTQAAEEYPEQKFINLDGQMEEIPSNVYIMAPKNNEMSYLAGAAAALKAKELNEGVIGFVGGMDIPGINEFLVGYIEGALEINPDIKVAASYVGNFTDTAKGKENALILYNSGIPVIFAAAGQSGIGVIDGAVEKGKFVIGVDSDQAESLKDSRPDMANVIITSAIKNIPENAVTIARQAMNGEVKYGSKGFYGIKEGAVGIAENEFYEKLMTEAAREQIKELKNKVINGEIKLTDPTGLTTEEVNKIREDVRP